MAKRKVKSLANTALNKKLLPPTKKEVPASDNGDIAPEKIDLRQSLRDWEKENNCQLVMIAIGKTGGRNNILDCMKDDFAPQLIIESVAAKVN